LNSGVAEKKRSCISGFPGSLVFLPLAAWLILFPSSLSHGRVPTDSAERRQQIEKIEKNLNLEREQLLRVDEKEKRLLEELSPLEKEIEEKRKSLKELEEKVSSIKKDLRENQAKVNQLGQSVKELEDRLGKRLDAFYRYAKRGYIRLLATADGLDTLRKRFKYLRGLLAEDLALLQETADLQKQYRDEISSVEEKLLDLDRLEKEESARAAEVKADIDKKVVLLMKTHKEKEFLETGVKELEIGSQMLKDTLIQIEKRDEKRIEIPSDFAKAKGKLPMPLEGRILKEGASSQSSSKGITIEGRPGADVSAVYAGRIDFSGSLKGYGQIVVINHGSRYFTVSALLAQRKKEEGETVKAGEVIGSLGGPPSARDARLYFEIRKGGGNLDPLRWLKLH
jgi:septal ring factor EnvC (AmiA/AmiB activator)